MRQLNFRAWNKVTKEYNNFVELTSYIDGSLGVTAGTNNNYPIGNTDIFVLEQYTGLKDKHGKCVYEGDIIKVKGETECSESFMEETKVIPFELLVKVYYNTDIACFDLETIEADIYIKGWSFYGKGTEKHLEVIGNIHKNKDLI